MHLGIEEGGLRFRKSVGKRPAAPAATGRGHDNIFKQPARIPFIDGTVMGVGIEVEAVLMANGIGLEEAAEIVEPANAIGVVAVDPERRSRAIGHCDRDPLIIGMQPAPVAGA